MEMNKEKTRKRLRRKRHIRKRVFGTTQKPRFTVFRSSKHLYGQIINDELGATLASASTMGKDAKALIQQAGLRTGGRAAAAILGNLLATKALGAGVKKVVFDRNGYRFHGRIREFADSAKKNGLEF
jgi:large subunit ribosomal protein L18